MNEDGDGVPIYRMNEINDMLCAYQVDKWASVTAEDKEAFALLPRDVLFNRTNSQKFVGRTGLFLPWNEETRIFASYLVRLQPVCDLLEPEYLTAFLNCSRGQADIKRRARLSINQSNVNPEEVKAIRIPLLSKRLQSMIGQFFTIAHASKKRAAVTLADAEALLEQALGLHNWTPPVALSYERKLQEVNAASRFDAEYYDPRKDQALARLSEVPGKPLSEYVTSIKDTFDPSQPHEPFKVRNYDLPDALTPVLDATKGVTLSNELGSTKKLVQNGDIVISRLRSYLREIAVVETPISAAPVVSTEFLVLRFRDGMTFPQEALWTFLQSNAVQTILRYCVDGSQHPRFSESDLLQIPVPDVVVQFAPEVAVRFKTAAAARNRATELLESAKHAVDIAIEQSEEAALAYLRAQT